MSAETQLKLTQKSRLERQTRPEIEVFERIVNAFFDPRKEAALKELFAKIQFFINTVRTILREQSEKPAQMGDLTGPVVSGDILPPKAILFSKITTMLKKRSESASSQDIQRSLASQLKTG